MVSRSAVATSTLIGALCLGVAATLSACDATSPDRTQLLRAKPLKPAIGQLNPIAAEGVVGSWEMVLSSHGVRSLGSGGACLLEKLDDFGGGPYSPATGCPGFGVPGTPTATPTATTVTATHPPIWESYPHPEDNTCWVRPKNGWCNRSLDYPDGPQIWNLGHHAANLQTVEAKPNSNWRVVTCLREFDTQTGKDSDKCTPEWGPVFTVPL
jgi:hypothetical protein